MTAAHHVFSSSSPRILRRGHVLTSRVEPFQAGIWQFIWSATGSESGSDGSIALIATGGTPWIANYGIYTASRTPLLVTTLLVGEGWGLSFQRRHALRFVLKLSRRCSYPFYLGGSTVGSCSGRCENFPTSGTADT